MLHLLALLLVATAQQSPGSDLPRGAINGVDPPQGRTAVTGMILPPGHIPECADAYQAQRAEEEQIKGFTPECIRSPTPRRKPRKD